MKRYFLVPATVAFVATVTYFDSQRDGVWDAELTILDVEPAVTGVQGAYGPALESPTETRGSAPASTLVEIISLDLSNLADHSSAEVRIEGIDPIFFSSEKIAYQNGAKSYLGTVTQKGISQPATITVSNKAVLATLPSSMGVVEIFGPISKPVARFRATRDDHPESFPFPQKTFKPEAAPEAVCKNC